MTVRTVIRQIAEDIWTFSRPFDRYGIFPVGGRSTAIRLGDGGIWILASTMLDEETKAKIDELGKVEYIIGANVVHWLYLGDFKKAYPEAKLIGVKGLVGKKGCPVFDGAYGVDDPATNYGYEGEIQSCHFTGFMNSDVVFNHIPSRTLLQADLIMNLPAREQYSMFPRKPFLSSAKLAPDTWIHQVFVKLGGSNKEAMKRDVEAVAAWDFDRIIPCHGDVIETDGKKAWVTLFKSYLE